MSTVNVRSCMAASMTGVLAMLVSFAAPAQSYPARPIELISHTSAGSGTDVIARAVADVFRREKLLPQPFVVVNRVGGAGVIAYSYFKTKRGDPYVMLTVAGMLISFVWPCSVRFPLIVVWPRSPAVISVDSNFALGYSRTWKKSSLCK